jgi:hypothetical protein
MRDHDKVRPISRPDSGSRGTRGIANGSSRPETFTVDGSEGDIAHPVLMAYCAQCQGRRGVLDWHDRGDVLLVILEPCGHVAELTARLEWLPYGEAQGVPATAGVASPRRRVATFGA